VPITDISLAVSAIPRRGNGARAAVGLVVEARGAAATEVAIAVAKVGGKITDLKRGVLRPSRDGRGEIVGHSTTTADLAPGTYHLRVAALDPVTGSRGSVLHDFEVPNFSKDPVSISGLTLWEVQPARAATTRRTFLVSETVDVSAEIYWARDDGAPMIAISVVDDRQAVVYRQQSSVDGPQRNQSGLESVATIAFDRFGPGTYTVRVEAVRAGRRPWSSKRETSITLVTSPP
jgi:hypothetical protein